jgi:hypothetical protein
MNKFFMGCLSVCALALMIGQAIAGGNTQTQNAKNMMNDADNGGVVIIETYSSSVVSSPSDSNDMQPLPQDPGVEVAPVDSSSEVEPVWVEEDVWIQQTGSDN